MIKVKVGLVGLVLPLVWFSGSKLVSLWIFGFLLNRHDKYSQFVWFGKGIVARETKLFDKN